MNLLSVKWYSYFQEIKEFLKILFKKKKLIFLLVLVSSYTIIKPHVLWITFTSNIEDCYGLSWQSRGDLLFCLSKKKLIYRLLENSALELAVNPDVSMEHLISSDQTSVSALPLQLVSQIARY